MPITYTSIFVKAVAEALKSHPIVNSQLQEDKIKVFSEINIGVAVAIEEGLIVPAIHEADKKNVSKIAFRLKELAEKAKNRTLSLNEINTGTFMLRRNGRLYKVFTARHTEDNWWIFGCMDIKSRVNQSLNIKCCG